MPIYSFFCSKCQDDFEIVQKISEYSGKAKCPNCHKKSSQRLYDVPHCSIILGNHELKTVGHVVDRNTEKMSNDEKSHLTHKHNEYKYNKKYKELPRGMSRLPLKERERWVK